MPSAYQVSEWLIVNGHQHHTRIFYSTITLTLTLAFSTNSNIVAY